MKDGSQIACNATCCRENNCVTPYSKSKFQIQFWDWHWIIFLCMCAYLHSGLKTPHGPDEDERTRECVRACLLTLWHIRNQGWIQDFLKTSERGERYLGGVISEACSQMPNCLHCELEPYWNCYTTNASNTTKRKSQWGNCPEGFPSFLLQNHN